jgi:exonuclease SbcC
MAVFAFSNGDMGRSYDVLYSGFKKYYAEHQSRLREFDIAFVYCVPPGAAELERFCSRIETDVYFCRKYVIPLSEQIESSLARLPFLPLAALRNRPLRPPSAQTLLQQRGVPTDLARIIVVPQQRSADGIVQDCLNKVFGDPIELASRTEEKAPAGESERLRMPVRLKSVEIKNFRAYRKTQLFDIGEHITVLYGPNGFGKTSFFDAIDFAITGGIGRFRSASETRFAKAVRHLDSAGEQSVVTLRFASGDAVHQIERRIDNPARALLDRQRSDRKRILTEISGGSIPGSDRVENIINLFRATHLFTQEDPELMRDFQASCGLPEEVVSRMLAFEDYTNAVKKMTEVRNALSREIESAQANVDELSDQIAKEKLELERLAQATKDGASVGAFDAEAASVRAKLRDAGIDLGEDDKASLENIRSWRTVVEARRAESQTRISRLSALTQDVTHRHEIIEMEAKLQKQLSEIVTAYATTQNDRAATAEAVRVAEARLAEVRTQHDKVRSYGEAIQWAQKTKPRYQELQAQERAASDNLAAATHGLAEARALEAKYAADLRQCQHLSDRAARTLGAKRREANELQSVMERAALWNENLTRIASIYDLEKEETESLQSLREKEQELTRQLADLQREEARLSGLISDVDRDQSDLKKLLSPLVGHIHDGVCPLCGYDHGAREELLARIEKQISRDSASSARNELNRLREHLRELMAQTRDLKHQLESAEERTNNLGGERANLNEENSNFEAAAARIDVLVEPSGPFPMEEVRSRYAGLQSEIKQLAQDAGNAASQLTSADAALTETKALVAARESDVGAAQTKLAELQSELNQLRNDPRSTVVSLDVEPEQLAKSQALSVSDLGQLVNDRDKAQTDASLQASKVSALVKQMDSLRGQQTNLQRELARLGAEKIQIAGRLQEAGLSIESDQASLLALIEKESGRQEGLSALRDSVSNLELVVDAATTAAAHAALLQSIHEKEKAVLDANAAREQYLPWVTYFDQVSGLLSSEQTEAIVNFTRDYGPRTSIIQQRLRSVYGFDEIEVHAQERTITVRVKRRGEELRPTDYFSQSQQQTLMLSLFLTACISQTWSSLSPVFLDDPVTHFDDLNTYAFLDLILGLLESDSIKRQFVISTCDDRLLQLALYKFRHLGESAIFYGFSAIGADGPVVDEIKLH